VRLRQLWVTAPLEIGFTEVLKIGKTQVLARVIANYRCVETLSAVAAYAAGH
jgi:hypothetical protein